MVLVKKLKKKNVKYTPFRKFDEDFSKTLKTLEFISSVKCKKISLNIEYVNFDSKHLENFFTVLKTFSDKIVECKIFFCSGQESKPINSFIEKICKLCSNINRFEVIFKKYYEALLDLDLSFLNDTIEEVLVSTHYFHRHHFPKCEFCFRRCKCEEGKRRVVFPIPLLIISPIDLYGICIRGTDFNNIVYFWSKKINSYKEFEEKYYFDEFNDKAYIDKVIEYKACPKCNNKRVTNNCRQCGYVFKYEYSPSFVSY